MKKAKKIKNQKLIDEKFMRIALELAARAKGNTCPNPMVGAVLVKKGEIIGSGYHKKAGQPHAEINALKKAGTKSKNSTLYITLEPCSNFGKTPPCATTILSSRIKRVVVATKDPNPINRNRGIAFLRKNGIKIKVGILRKEAERLNQAYNKFITTNIPLVTIKAAMSLDGKIATKRGSSKWISCPKSRQFVKRLRKNVDAVLVGRNTFLKDKPRLKGIKYRVVLESRKTNKQPNTLYPFYINSKKWYFWYGDKSNNNMKKLLKELAKLGIMHVLVEGGGEIIASAINNRLVDNLYLFIAPKIIGGRNAVTPVEGKGIGSIQQALKVRDMQIEKIGKDILVTGKL